MKLLRNIPPFLFCFIVFIEGYCQKIPYNINIYNGLPTNHVYNLMRDRLGYLWITTPKGIVKYNGYETKRLGLLDGMGNEDVWALYEDHKGRIWLYTISKNIGYVLNNKYHRAYINDPAFTFYPRMLTDTRDGIVFLSPYHICVERNDTIHQYKIPTSLWPVGFAANREKPSLLLNTTSHLLMVTLANGRLVEEDKCAFDSSVFQTAAGKAKFLFKTNIVGYTFFDGTINVLNTENCKHRTLELFNDPDEKIYTHHIEKNSALYFISNKNIYKLDSTLNGFKVYPIKELLNGAPFRSNEIAFLLEDNIWGTCIATNFNGIYIRCDTGNFKKLNIPEQENYKTTGSGLDKFYLWNESARVLALVQPDGKTSFNKLPSVKNLKKLVYDDSGRRILVVTDSRLAWFHEATGTIKDFANNTRGVRFGSLYYTDAVLKQSTWPFIMGINDAKIINVNLYYLVASSHWLTSAQLTADSVIFKPHGDARYRTMEYDTRRQLLWLYNSEEILIHNLKTGKEIRIKKDMLDKLNIKKIEAIVIDGPRGNVLVKDYDRLLLYNYYRQDYKQLFNEYRLINSHISLKGNVITVAGKFGVLFSRITGRLNVTPPILYRNTKTQHYTHIENLQQLDDKILLGTDAGFYLVDVPVATDFTSKQSEQPYRFIISYNDTSQNIVTGDTINIDQQNQTLQFDIINPLGVGTVKYEYNISGWQPGWRQLNTNELYLPELNAGEYYTVSFLAMDDVWKSKAAQLHIYIKPYWWQTGFGKRSILIGGILISLGFIYLIVFTTKRIVSKKHMQKNLNLEIELKSIYSQINPHFIFNSLNTGLFFIKKAKNKEAYEHISAFSNLLRSYIKSSRNKFTTVAEEIENLQNYIQLQQARFETPFEYQIRVSDETEIHGTKLPSLLLQPLVENAIVHGIFHKETTGHLIIDFKIDKPNNTLTCVIDDDGIGREQSKLMHSAYKTKADSYGSHLIKDLINIFNTSRMSNITLNYIDKQPPLTGTTVILTIKNVNHEN